MPTAVARHRPRDSLARAAVGLAVAFVALSATAGCDRTSAAGPPVQAATGPARPAQPAIDRYIGGTTLVVLSVDVAAIDPPAVAAWAGRACGPDAGLLTARLTPWRERFLAAGATHLYLLVSADRSGVRVAVLVPHAATADAAALESLVRPAAAVLLGDRGGRNLVVRPHGMALVAGTPAAVSELIGTAEDPYRARHDGLTAALGRAGDGPVRAGFATSEGVRAGLALTDPPLPVWLGGGRAQVLAGNIDWATADLRLPTASGPDAASCRMVLAASGGSARASVAAALAIAAARGPGEFAAAGWADAAALVARLRPEPCGDGLEARLSADDLAAALPALLPRLKAATE
ncbi:MAG TPA: hypothetical protein VF796_06945 [Humisphaera sp.]